MEKSLLQIDVSKSIYVVRKGDTAYRIARCYGVDLKALVKLNTMISPYLIRVGQKIQIPKPIGSPGCSANVETRLGRARGMSRRTVARDEVSNNYIVSPPALTEKKAKKLEAPPARAGTKFLWPVKGTLVSKFGVKPGNLSRYFNAGSPASCWRSGRRVGQSIVQTPSITSFVAL